jgi:pimeloyl-ACP methyl ester carboxylesterase
MDLLVDRYLYPPCPSKTGFPTYVVGGHQCLVYKNPAAKRWIIYMHGNMTTLHDLQLSEIPSALALSCEANVIAPEYPGYGDLSAWNAGDRDRACTHVLYDVIKYLTDEEAGDILVVGQSLGTAIATQTMASYPNGTAGVTGVALISPFSSVRAMSPFAIRCLVPDRLNTAKNVGAIFMPICVIHGDMDEYVPMSQGRKVADASCSDLIIIRGMTHCMTQAQTTQVVENISIFARKCARNKKFRDINVEQWHP